MVGLLGLMVVSHAWMAPGTVADFASTESQFRAQREASLIAPTGWLQLDGLAWLPMGETRLAVSNAGRWSTVSDPNGRVDAIFTREKNAVLVSFPRGSEAKLNGAKVNGAQLITDADGWPDTITIQSCTMVAIKRGSRIGLRIWNSKGAAIQKHQKLNWFSADKNWNIKAKFVRYAKPKTLQIVNVLGDVNPVENPGYVVFQVGGKACRLEAESAGDGLFFNFKDQTSGKTTYGAGRFLSVDGPKNGFVWLNFNRAVNPPCAYTDFATCPLPPKANSLPIAVLAGEKMYRPH